MIPIFKLKRYPNTKHVICPYCLTNESIGETDYGTLGCLACQSAVDREMASLFGFIMEVELS